MKSSNFLQSQQFLRCGLHAVNNLLGEEFFSPNDFHILSENLKQQTQTSHETFCLISIGNYDINVLQMALHHLNYECKWFNDKVDNHKNLITDANVIGCLLNVKLREQRFYEKYLDWDPRHWYTIKKLSPQNENDEICFLILDSREKTSQFLAYNENEILTYLNNLNDDTVILYITKQQQQQNQNQ